MSVKYSNAWLLALLTFGLITTAEVSAQHYQPLGPVDYTPTLQPFATVNDFLLEDLPPPNEGYFFTYERLNWTATKPERTPIGQAGAVAATAGPLSELLVTNSIDSSVPNSPRGWGNRYELGYVVDNEGWLVSVLARMRAHVTNTYGFDGLRVDGFPAVQGLPGVDGIPDDSPLAPPMTAPPGVAPVAQVPGIAPVLAIDGSIAVAVVFQDPLGLLNGFVDFNGDGFDDDVNNNLVFGRDGADPGNTGTPTVPAPTDFGDLEPFAVVFDTLTATSRANINGVELMKIKRMLPTHHGSIIEFFYGVRYLQWRDRFTVNALGGVFADSYWDTNALNSIIGPQIGARIAHTRRRWTFALEGRFLAGANFISIDQNVLLGTLLASGADGFPLRFGPTAVLNKSNSEQFSPVGELRVESTFKVTERIALKVGWTGIVAGQIARGSTNTAYVLPTFGILNRWEDVFTNGVNFGVEVNR